jgi:uncharacterized membrane protein YkvA (DUF1232 family)
MKTTKVLVKSRLRRGFSFQQEIVVLYFAAKDKRTPFYAKGIAIFALVYLISPIDLIPDFIPVAGYLDDLVIVPLLLHIAFLVLPNAVKDSGRTKAKEHVRKLRVIFFILLVGLVGLLACIFLLIRTIFHHL